MGESEEKERDGTKAPVSSLPAGTQSDGETGIQMTSGTQAVPPTSLHLKSGAPGNCFLAPGIWNQEMQAG